MFCHISIWSSTVSIRFLGFTPLAWKARGCCPRPAPKWESGNLYWKQISKSTAPNARSNPHTLGQAKIRGKFELLAGMLEIMVGIA